MSQMSKGGLQVIAFLGFESYCVSGLRVILRFMLKDINSLEISIHSQHLHNCNPFLSLPRHASPASFVVSSRANMPRAYARCYQEVASQYTGLRSQNTVPKDVPMVNLGLLTFTRSVYSFL